MMGPDRSPNHNSTATAVLVSGGLDSAILTAALCRDHSAVHPLFIRQGYHWEPVELAYLERFLKAVARPVLRPLRVLDVPLADLLPNHWAVTGRDVPDQDTPDEAVFLPGRNLLFLSKAMLWCHLRGVPAVALGILHSNPFPDAAPAFFDAIETAFQQALGTRVIVTRPLEHLGKTEVLQRGKALPLALTFSCIQPRSGLHCGACNKCAERMQAFQTAGLPDPTTYADHVHLA